MTNKALAFLGLAFILYWLSTHDLPSDQVRDSLAPALPKALRRIASPDDKPSFRESVENRKATEMFQTWLKNESQAVGQTDKDPELTLRRLKARARRLRNLEIGLLEKTALDTSLNGDERFLAVYLLGLNERPVSLEALKQVAFSTWPTTHGDRDYTDETVIRVHALESAVKRLSRQESVLFLHEILRQTADPLLAKHAQYWLSRLG